MFINFDANKIFEFEVYVYYFFEDVILAKSEFILIGFLRSVFISPNLNFISGYNFSK